MTEIPAVAREYAVTVPIPDDFLKEGSRVVVLSNRLAIVWTRSAMDMGIIFDGQAMGRVLNICMEADSEDGLHWGITLGQTPSYEQPADFISELSRCGFAVVVKDYRNLNEEGEPEVKKL